jgi:hypothetical protein
MQTSCPARGMSERGWDVCNVVMVVPLNREVVSETAGFLA